MNGYSRLLRKINGRSARVGVIGLGYVGLPLIIRFSEEGFRVTGFDIDSRKVDSLNRGRSYIKHISSASISQIREKAGFEASHDMAGLRKMDAVIICVPTPLSANREPDISHVRNTAMEVARRLRSGQLVCLESTTYPGTTDELMKPILEGSGLKAGRDFFLVFSPEREDPGRSDFTTRTIPKVVGGDTARCLALGKALYSSIVDKAVPVSSTRTAEMTKLLENIYRAVNIALVNELKMLCDRMGMDIWEVIKASSTKPFGFQPFYPGPGLGGHCIPIDPFYLTWKAREFGFSTRFIELAGEINSSLPRFVVDKAADALNKRGKALKGSRVLVLGMAYKKDTDDLRESPSIELVRLFEEKGAAVDYNDPFIPIARSGRKGFLKHSIKLTDRSLKAYDCVLIATDHSQYDYRRIVEKSSLVVDTRNATSGIRSRKIVKA